MAEANDWRLNNQEKYLKGIRLEWKMYAKPRLDWDHDHCEFCTEKFAEKQDTPQRCTRDMLQQVFPGAQMDTGGSASNALMISKISSNGRQLS